MSKTAGAGAPDRLKAENEALRCSLKETILNIESLAELAERVLRRANEQLEKCSLNYDED